MTQRKLDRRTLIGGAAFATSVLLPRFGAGQENARPANADAIREGEIGRIRMSFDGHAMVAVLYDNPSARDFAAMLPLHLTIEDFGRNEKIAHLPRKLTEEGSGPFGDERAYDLCYYKPWGNLAMFYEAYTYGDLIRLGRFVEGTEALHVRGEFPLRVERIS